MKVRHFFCLDSLSFRRMSAMPYLRRALLLILFGLVHTDPAVADTAYWTPWVTNLATDSATINWFGADDAKNRYSVEYATSSHYQEKKTFQTKIESPAQGTFQHVLVTGLEPNTSYVYKVTVPSPPEDTYAFPLGYFKTMPVSGPFTFLVISDSHAQEGRFKYDRQE
jgi:phosphodiesterase/alkaline phosphatase D-like protein